MKHINTYKSAKICKINCFFVDGVSYDMNCGLKVNRTTWKGVAPGLRWAVGTHDRSARWVILSFVYLGNVEMWRPWFRLN